MAKLTFVFAALFCLIALSRASESQGNDLTASEVSTVLPESVPQIDQLIELPSTKVESEAVDQIQHQPESTDPELLKLNDKVAESTEDLTTVTFRPADHQFDRSQRIPVSFRFPFRRGKPCHHRHGRRHFKPTELSYGNDMILSNDKKGSDDADEKRPARWVKFHHHGKPKFGDRSEMMEMVWERDDMWKPHHRHHFEREENKEKDGQPHHHHHHQHHHHEEVEEEKEGGFMTKIRKFLMDRF